MTTRWGELASETRQRAAATRVPKRVRNEIVIVLKRLADAGQCSQQVQGWLTTNAECLTFSPSADGRDGRGHPAVTLRGLPHLQDGAVLSMQIEFASKGALRGYNLGVTGATRQEDLWYARLDLGLMPEGSGLCGHPLLHFHGGRDPDEDPQVRAPLAWLEPVDALTWLLATLDPRHEP